MLVVEVELKPSDWTRRSFVLVHFFAVWAITLLASPWLWLAFLLWLGLVWHYRYLLSRKECAYLKWGGGGWEYKAHGCWEPAVLHHAIIWPWLVVLNTSRYAPIIIFPHQCESEQLRQLRVLLRHQPVFGEGSELKTI